MIALLIPYMAITSRLAGSGFGQKWGAAWLPEALFTYPFGFALGYALAPHIGPNYATLAGVIGWLWSFGFMQSATWMFLRWESHDNPNTKRGGTLKGLTDHIAKVFGYKLGDEGYAWVAAGVKGFLIGLPVGGVALAILWPLGYEIGSHATGRTEKYGIDPHAVSEVAAGVGAALSVALFLALVRLAA